MISCHYVRLTAISHAAAPAPAQNQSRGEAGSFSRGQGPFADEPLPAVPKGALGDGFRGY